MSQRDHLSSHSKNAGDNELVPPDDIQEVLATLHLLAKQSRHPVVRACLEQAHDDIVHLTSYGDEAHVGNDGAPAPAA